MTFEDLQEAATKLIEVNKECFVAQWIIQNPDKNIGDFTLAYQPCFDGKSGIWFSIEAKKND